MIEIAEVFRRFADDYQAVHGASMLPSHRRSSPTSSPAAPRRSAASERCDQCGAEVFAYHSCKNRSCPKCHTDGPSAGEARKLEMLPTPYFHVTITVPEELRAVLRANQRDGYALLMKAAAEAIIDLPAIRFRRPHSACSPCFIPGPNSSFTTRVSIAWSAAAFPRTAATGFSPQSFLVPVKALARLVRGKLGPRFEEPA